DFGRTRRGRTSAPNDGGAQGATLTVQHQLLSNIIDSFSFAEAKPVIITGPSTPPRCRVPTRAPQSIHMMAFLPNPHIGRLQRVADSHSGSNSRHGVDRFEPRQVHTRERSLWMDRDRRSPS